MTGLALSRPNALPEGLHRFDPVRDLRGVIDLLEIGFRDDLEARDRRWLADLSKLSRTGPISAWLLRSLPRRRAFDGFVWYRDGRLVGNVSLMRCSRDVWVLANVVTHPHHRGRGIAQAMLESALHLVQSKGGSQVQLQVREDNQAAHRLYALLGFWRMNAATTMRLDPLEITTHFSLSGAGLSVGRVSGSALANKGRRLLARAGELDRGGPAGLLIQALEHHWLWDGMEDWLRGFERPTWAVLAEGEYRGLLGALTPIRHGPHRIDMVVDPGWRGRVELPLLQVALQGLAQSAPHGVEAEVDTRRDSVLDALRSCGFRPVRTLDRLAFDLLPQ
jgi:ribosomal protein S18 acetylase RimI-like enzyme